jgi:hypothetical protein
MRGERRWNCKSVTTMSASDAILTDQSRKWSNCEPRNQLVIAALVVLVVAYP